MCQYRVGQHLIVLNLYSISNSEILVTESMTIKVSQKLNLMQKMSTQWKVIECLKKSNIQMITKHSKTNWVQKNIEYKTNDRV